MSALHAGAALRIAAIRLLCPDPVATARFYEAVFGCRADRVGGGVTLTLGHQRIELVRTAAPRGTPARANETSFQHCAAIVSDMAAACGHLGTLTGWTAISRAGPERLPASSGGVSAFKFRDPDGHPLELLAFPPGLVPPAWAGRPGLFLGIDHTAITVADTDRAVAYYAGLGFTVGSRGVNRGDEQARLDDVSAPVVEVTGLIPPGGAPPHLELLCYREPGTRAVPVAVDAVLATRLVLEGAGRESGRATRQDPDGHRHVVREG